MRADRLLAMLLTLQTRGGVPAPELARLLEVSERTVHRDVEALSAAGVPVYAERGRHGGIRLLDGYRTKVPGLSVDEARSLFALTSRQGMAELGFGTDLAAALRKVFAALPERQRPEAERAASRILLDPTGWMRRPEPMPHLPVLQRAVFDDRRLRLDYRHSGATATRRYTVDPYGLVAKSGVWYLVADVRGDPRLFRVGRVTSVQVLADVATQRAGVTLADLWDRLRASVERRPLTVRARVRIRSDVVGRVLRMCAAAVVEESRRDRPDGDVEIELAYPALEAARGALLGFADDVEVLAPPELRAEMTAAAGRVLRLYDADASPG